MTLDSLNNPTPNFLQSTPSLSHLELDEGLSAKEFAEPDNFFRMGMPPVMVDMMPKVSGVEFDESWSWRVDEQIADDLSLPFISRRDLLTAKLAAASSLCNGLSTVTSKMTRVARPAYRSVKIGANAVPHAVECLWTARS
jgi:hypothetical protein